MAAWIVNVCFHGIGTPQRTLEPGEQRYWITRDTYLRTLDRLAGRDEVRISFDDGNLSDLEIGLPGLLERGLSATFFPVAGRIGQAGSLDGSDLRELAGHRMRIGTHGMDHRSWRGLDEPDHRRELADARSRIAEESGTEVTDAALPLGQYDRQVLRRLRTLGYRRVHSSDRRWTRETAWLQPRFSIRAEDTAESFADQVLTRPGWVRQRVAELRTRVKSLR